jgi:outer membrane protein OmpA-like peptidoglycan-associated protein
MNKTLIIALTIIGLSPLAAVHADNHGMVNGYVTDSAGGVVTSSSGDCVRTTPKDSMNKLEACGYKPMVEESVEVVATKTAVSATKRIGQDVIIAAGILFGFDSAELSDNGKAIILERIAALGHKKNQAEVRVIGYTDSTGPEAYNQKLSERRALSVASFIEQMKESPDTNVEYVGMGEANPLQSNDTREGRAANRRVEIIAVGIIQE